METYQVVQKITGRTLTVEVPKEFEGAEVDVKVVILQNGSSDDTQKEKADKWEALRRAKGIARNSTVKIDEDEWYQQRISSLIPPYLWSILKIER